MEGHEHRKNKVKVFISNRMARTLSILRKLSLDWKSDGLMQKSGIPSFVKGSALKFSLLLFIPKSDAKKLEKIRATIRAAVGAAIRYYMEGGGKTGESYIIIF